jgi:hypothetical protein
LVTREKSFTVKESGTGKNLIVTAGSMIERREGMGKSVGAGEFSWLVNIGELILVRGNKSVRKSSPSPAPRDD